MNFSLSPTDFHTFLKHTFAFVEKSAEFLLLTVENIFPKMDDCQHSMMIKSDNFT